MVELIAAVSVIGLLLLISVPNIEKISQKWILETTAREMVEDIRWAQNLAIVEGKSYNFEIDLLDKSYLIRPVGIKNPSIKKVKLDQSIIRITSTLSNMDGSFTRKVLTYSLTGNPNQTGSIILETKDGSRVTITVAVGSGRVRILR